MQVGGRGAATLDACAATRDACAALLKVRRSRSVRSVHASMHFTSLPCPLPQAGFVLHESTAYAAYLLRRGVPAGDLLKECQVGWAGCTAGRSMSPQAQLARMHQMAGLLARTVYLIPLADEARQQCMHPPAAVVRHGGQRLLLALYARPACQLAVSTWASGCLAAAAWLWLLGCSCWLCCPVGPSTGDGCMA